MPLQLDDRDVAQRERAAATYESLLRGRVGLMGRNGDRTSVHAQYTVVIEERDAVQATLHELGVPTAVHYPVPIHMQPAYARLGAADTCPVARSLAARVMSLPMGPYLADADIRRVCRALLGAVDATAAGANQSTLTLSV